MIKLYYAPGTCALSVNITLQWLKVDYDAIEVTLGDPEYLKINPLGAVPAMTDGDSKVMAQCDALLKYLAHKYPEASLGDNGELADIYELDHWLAFMTGDLHPAYFPVFSPQRYTTYEDKDAFLATKTAGLKLVERMLNHIDSHLEGKRHIVGERRTIADAYAFAMIRWSKPLENHPNLKRFYDVMLRDDGVKNAMIEHGIS